MNHFSCIGRLTRDPEARSFANGGRVVRFGVALNNRRKNSQTGEWEDEPCFLDMEAWGKTGEFVETHFQKGDPIVVCQARVKQESWEKEGQKRSRLVFTAEQCEFPPKSKDRDVGETKPAGKTQRAKATAKAPGQDYDEGGFPVSGDDDLPF